MEDALTALSRRTAALVAEHAPHVVRVEGRRRGPASGVVWSADGLVVTAHHVLERDEEVEIGLASGERATAEVLGRDPTTDLALLRASATGLPVPVWTDEAPAPGELVLSLSRPGKSVRAALGMVARTAGEWRTGAGGKIDRYLETSLDLAPGLSGSLAIGAGGAALGVACAGLVRGTVMVVPPATLRRVVGALAAHGAVRRGYLGIATFPVRLGALAARAGQPHALLVSAVEPESPAERGGLLVGDALLALGGEPVTEPGDLLPVLEEDRIGQPVAARIVRGGEVRELTVTVGARGERAGRRP
ncbi:MAG TPA: S1C family serine protease [Anaeromyxobacter sp.]